MVTSTAVGMPPAFSLFNQYLTQLEKRLVKALRVVLASMHVPALPSLVKTEPAESFTHCFHAYVQNVAVQLLHHCGPPLTKRDRTFAKAAKYQSKYVSDMEVDSIRHSLASNSSSATSTVKLESFQVIASEQSAVDNFNELCSAMC